MNQEKIAAVLAMDAKARFAYFIRKVVDFEEVWGLDDHGWATAEDDAGVVTVPFWPEREFAAVCAVGAWAGYRPRPLTLDEFVSKWLPGMKRDGRLVAVLPTDRGKGVLMDPDDVRLALDEEMKQYVDG